MRRAWVNRQPLSRRVFPSFIDVLLHYFVSAFYDSFKVLVAKAINRRHRIFFTLLHVHFYSSHKKQIIDFFGSVCMNCKSLYELSIHVLIQVGMIWRTTVAPNFFSKQLRGTDGFAKATELDGMPGQFQNVTASDQTLQRNLALRDSIHRFKRGGIHIFVWFLTSSPGSICQNNAKSNLREYARFRVDSR
jgi:hypothetical protein